MLLSPIPDIYNCRIALNHDAWLWVRQASSVVASSIASLRSNAVVLLTQLQKLPQSILPTRDLPWWDTNRKDPNSKCIRESLHGYGQGGSTSCMTSFQVLVALAGDSSRDHRDVVKFFDIFVRTVYVTGVNHKFAFLRFSSFSFKFASFSDYMPWFFITNP